VKLLVIPGGGGGDAKLSRKQTDALQAVARRNSDSHGQGIMLASAEQGIDHAGDCKDGIDAIEGPVKWKGPKALISMLEDIGAKQEKEKETDNNLFDASPLARVHPGDLVVVCVGEHRPVSSTFAIKLSLTHSLFIVVCVGEHRPVGSITHVRFCQS
jgi:hypothetical protein